MEISGNVIAVIPKTTGTTSGGKSWVKQEFVIETTDQYPKKVCFCMFGDKTAIIDTFVEGESVTVSFDVESKEYNGKWYNSINAWKVDVQGNTSKKTKQPAEKPFEDSPNNDFVNMARVAKEEDDELPF